MQTELNHLLTSAADLLQSFKLVEAQSIYQQILTKQPGHPMAMLGLAIVYNRTDAPEKAKKMLEPLLVKINQLQQTRKPPHQKNKGSVKQNTAAPSIDPAAVATVYAQMGFACHQLNQLSEARNFYQKSLAVYPSVDVENLLKQVDKPLTKPSPEQAVLAKVNQLVAENQVAEAIEIMKKATELAPESPALLHGLGMLLRHLQQPDQAMPLVQQAIILEPTNPIYYNDLGMIFQDRAEYQKAVSFYKRAIKLDENYAAAYSNLGVAYKCLEQIEDAIASYQKAIEIKPNMAAAHNNLGNLYRMMGKKQEAQTHLLKAIELVPDYADAKKNLAALFSEA